MKAILGISDSHNAAAALINADGKLRALQEERPKRIKNYSGFPLESILWLLEDSGLKPSDIDQVALSSFHQPPDRTREQLIADHRNIQSVRSQLKAWLRHTPVFSLKKTQVKNARLDRLKKIGFAREQIQFYEHHQCHAATAYYGWGKFDEPVLVITCDGAGDGLCATVSVGEEGKLRRLYSIDWEHSIARVYAVVTYLMGMVPLEHEYKMMGMAPYAKGKDAEKIAIKLSGLFKWDESGAPVWRRARGIPEMYSIKPVLEQLFFEERFDAIMAGTQLFTERMLREFVHRAIKVTGLKKIALSGGIFMNVKANKEIMELDEVEDFFVFPSCGDETNAIGACYLAYAEKMGVGNIKPLGNFYFGPKWNDEDIQKAFKGMNLNSKYQICQYQDINSEIASLLAEGEVVARFWGHEEFGARSLGNRAILANPMIPEVIKEINEMIKSRDFWMPFAASILDEKAGEYLQNPKVIQAPYMILSFDSTDLAWRELRAGLHPYDRTCRPQIVMKEHNPDYWDLIKKFQDKTGIGGVLNTSLNLHGLPLVHKPEDAFEVLDKSGLKYLACGSFLISKT